MEPIYAFLEAPVVIFAKKLSFGHRTTSSLRLSRPRSLSVGRIPGEVDRKLPLARRAEFQNNYSLPSSTVMKLKHSANSNLAAVSGPRAWAVGLGGRWRS